MLFRNTEYTGGIQGHADRRRRSLFGLDINSITHPTRYGLFAVACFVLAALVVVATCAAGASGRRLIAVRTNERAAAALGISVPGAKLYAFGLSAGLAALGGILLAFRVQNVDYTSFDSFTSIMAVGLALIGGLGYLLGPIVGATLVDGRLQRAAARRDLRRRRQVHRADRRRLDHRPRARQPGRRRQRDDRPDPLGQAASSAGGSRGSRGRRGARPPRCPSRGPSACAPHTLEVRDLTVKYGGVTAVDDVSLTVQPGPDHRA